MTERASQLILPSLSQPKPLLERLGAEFFKGIPSTPGVYVLRDGAGRILYAGQSGNLRDRLAYYENDLPAALLRTTPPKSYLLPIKPQEWKARVHRFYLGLPEDLLAHLTNSMPPEADRFLQNHFQNDVLTVESFAEHGPKRHRALRQRFELGERLIQRHELDDLLVLRRSSGEGRKDQVPSSQALPLGE